MINFRWANARFLLKHRKNREKLPWEYPICCWGVKLFLVKYVAIVTVTTPTVTMTTVTICVFFSFFKIRFFEFCHTLSFWVLSQWVFEFCHNLCFLVVSQFGFLSFVTIWVFVFCHSSSFWVLTQFVFWGFVTIWVLCFVTLWVLEFCHNFKGKQDRNLTYRCALRGLRIYNLFNLFSLPIWVTFIFERHSNLSQNPICVTF